MKKDIIKKLLSVMVCFMLVFGISNTNVHAASNNVQLYSAKIIPVYGDVNIIESYYTTGYIYVKNIAPTKNVMVHFTYNGVNWLDTLASYEKTLSDGTEVFKYKTFENPYYSTHQIEYNCTFAIKYEVNGETYWDNNNGKNYFLQYSTMDYNAPYVLSKSAVKLHRSKCDNFTFEGSMIVRNLSYDKEVFVRYTADNWKTYNDIPAIYSNKFDNDTEKWNFMVHTTSSGTPFPYGSHGEFAICYKANGIEYWDNNFGENYTY